MEKSSLDRLMERYVRGEVSDAERAKIDAWLDALAKEDNTDLELSKQEEDRIFQKLTSTVTSVEEVVNLRPARRGRPDKWIARIAASLIAVAMLSYAGWYFSGTNSNAPEVIAKHGIEKVILSDGSLVWLQPQSKVLYYEKGDEGRYATFEGEAIFEVSKDPQRPFVVQCGDARVSVIGTSFSLKVRDEIVEVTVLTGKVNLSSGKNTKGIDLSPNEKAVYRRTGGIEKMITAEAEIATLLEHSEYNMHFTNTNVGEVLDRLADKFNVTVTLSDAAVRNCRITINLTDKSLGNSLQLLSEVLNTQYTVEGKSVSISGNGCD